MKNKELKHTDKKSAPTKKTLRTMLQDNKGLNTVEYAILLVLIVMVAFGSWKAIGEKLGLKVGEAATDILTM